MMKVSAQWKTLTCEQRRAWNAWAKSNPVLLDDGSFRRVSGRKAMTMVLRNRDFAGETANPAVVPAATAWLSGALSLRDAGPWTVNMGYIGFRADAVVPAGTKWFVWATPPVDDTTPGVLRLLQRVKFLTPAALAVNDLTPDLGPDYQAVNGSWDGPLLDGEWPTPKFIWFRLHQYANGQLSPGVLLRGQITMEL